MSTVVPLTLVLPRAPKPEWLKVRAPGSPSYLRLKNLMRELNLHTVCEEARCPNIGECWDHGTATFMILGDVCTRACAYCAVSHGRPAPLDPAEPVRVAEAIQALGLNYVVITSVDRDDVADGGAAIFAETIRETRSRLARCRIEVLIPDFRGNEAALHTVLDAQPDILNHNVETVPRLYRMARSGGRYDRTLQLFERARAHAPAIPTKTGLMVGLGEQPEEVIATFADLRAVGCEILTIGQYLAPHERARADGSLLPSRRIPRPESHGARDGLCPRRVWPARPQFVPRKRNRGWISSRDRRLRRLNRPRRNRWPPNLRHRPTFSCDAIDRLTSS